MAKFEFAHPRASRRHEGLNAKARRGAGGTEAFDFLGLLDHAHLHK